MVDNQRTPSADADRGAPERQRNVRLPGFVNDADIGVGDVVKRVTSAVGLRPCRGCERRAAALNRRWVISGRNERKR